MRGADADHLDMTGRVVVAVMMLSHKDRAARFV